MNRADLSPLYRTTIGFDRLAGLVDAARRDETKASSYPPYDIEVRGDSQYAISLAVAGFSAAELAIEWQPGVLTICGNKEKAGDESNYLYKGVSMRSFQRIFNLAEFIEVKTATLDNGLLTVVLEKLMPRALQPESIQINAVKQGDSRS